MIVESFGSMRRELRGVMTSASNVDVDSGNVDGGSGSGSSVDGASDGTGVLSSPSLQARSTFDWYSSAILIQRGPAAGNAAFSSANDR